MDARTITTEWHHYINMELGYKEDGGLCAILSFGDLDSKVEEYGMSLPDLSDLIMDSLITLANHGNPMAQHLYEQACTWVQENGEGLNNGPFPIEE